MKRRDFVTTILTGTTMTAGAVFLQACGSGDSSAGAGTAESGTPPDPGTDSQTDTGLAASCTETIANNHGHVMMVSAADVEAGEEKTYDIQGSAPHTHAVTVTASDFQTLQAGGTVTKTSTTGADHTHGVTIQCA